MGLDISSARDVRSGFLAQSFYFFPKTDKTHRQEWPVTTASPCALLCNLLALWGQVNRVPKGEQEAVCPVCHLSLQVSES